MTLSTAVKSGLHEVLLQAAIRAERMNEIREADRRASELAKRMDNRAKEER